MASVTARSIEASMSAQTADSESGTRTLPTRPVGEAPGALAPARRPMPGRLLSGPLSPGPRTARVSRAVAFAVAGGALAVLFAELYLGFTIRPSALSSGLGFDYQLYADAARRYLVDGSFYLPYQLAGPYQVVAREILYPPVILALLIPFTVLPAVLWWAIPLGITAAVLAWHRPSPWGWAAIGLLLVLPMPVPWALGTIVTGNPAMWAMAALAAGTVWGWPAVLVLLKPSLLPFGLVGIRTRRWWQAAGLLVVASITILPATVQYGAAILNARGLSPLYSLNEVPLMLIPLVAWISRLRATSAPVAASG